MQKVTELENLQVHYYLSNNSHSMDAKILNKVESELLKIIEEVSKILDLEIYVETQALEEGGIVSVYRFIIKKENLAKVAVVGAFFAGIIGSTMSDVIADSIKTDPEMERLKKEKIELEIKKLKQDIANDSIENTHLVSDDRQIIVSEHKGDEIRIDKELIDSIAIYAGENNRVKISKSKFYEYLLKEGKVEKVSTQVLDENFKPKGTEKFVPRSDFKYFVIGKSEVEPDYRQDVVLEIVSPVLNTNRLNWKANHNGQTKTFRLKDDKFKNLIVNKNLSFSNGTKIICDVETKLTINNNGEISEKGKSIYNVTQIIYPDGVVVDVK